MNNEANSFLRDYCLDKQTNSTQENTQRVKVRISPEVNVPLPTRIFCRATQHTCVAVEQEVSPVGIGLHEPPLEQLLDGTSKHQPRHVIAHLLQPLVVNGHFYPTPFSTSNTNDSPVFS